MKRLIKKIVFSFASLLHKLVVLIIGKQQIHRLLDNESVVDIVRKKAGSQLSPFYSVKIFHDYHQLAITHGVIPRNVLEIGTGCSLSTLSCFLGSGANRAVGVDIQPMDQKKAAHHKCMADYLAVASGIGWWRSSVDLNTPPWMTFEYFNEEEYQKLVDAVEYLAPVQASALPFPDHSFDYIYSNAVLEHIDDPELAIKEIHRVLQNDGVTAHEIDLRDHGSAFPLDFFKYSENSWNELTGKYGSGQGIEKLLEGAWSEVVYCNRLLLSDWQKIFEDSGFEIVKVEHLITVDEKIIDVSKFSEPFCDREKKDFTTIVVRLVAKKS